MLFTISGTLGSPVVELFQTTCRLSGVAGITGITDAARDTFLNSAGTATATFFNTAALGASSQSFVTLLKLSKIGNDGKLQSPTEMPRTKIVSYAGTGTTSHPLTTACVVSLRTARPRGRGAFGRMYWPAVAATFGSDGVQSVALRDATLAAAKVWADAINVAANAMLPGLRICVMSELGTGITEPVTRVGVGREPDYISRRKSKTVESTTFSNLA